VNLQQPEPSKKILCLLPDLGAWEVAQRVRQEG
jgi:hypothetical protein